MSGVGPTFIFAGGGTGGHLFPALAIAERLRAQSDGRARCVFLCSDRPLDAKILSDEGVRFVPSPARPIAMSPRGLARFVASWGPSLRQGRMLIRQYTADGKAPTVVAMGGFVAAPAAQAARAERALLVLVNLDAVPGKANRWIAGRVEPRGKVFTSIAVPAGQGPKSSGAWTSVPPIVRAGATASGDAAACRKSVGLDVDRPTLMVTGGSQGASSINALMAAMLERESGRRALSGWQVLHQTGGSQRDALASTMAGRYAAAGVRAVVREFVGGRGEAEKGEMARWWGASDLAVARAGANTVAEAWANRVPTLFLPYPYHRDQHQRFNAAQLVAAGGCWLATDRIDASANMAEAGKLLIELTSDRERLGRARSAMSALPAADGADRIARALLDGW